MNNNAKQSASFAGQGPATNAKRIGYESNPFQSQFPGKTKKSLLKTQDLLFFSELEYHRGLAVNMRAQALNELSFEPDRLYFIDMKRRASSAIKKCDVMIDNLEYNIRKRRMDDIEQNPGPTQEQFERLCSLHFMLFEHEGELLDRRVELLMLSGHSREFVLTAIQVLESWILATKRAISSLETDMMKPRMDDIETNPGPPVDIDPRLDELVRLTHLRNYLGSVLFHEEDDDNEGITALYTETAEAIRNLEREIMTTEMREEYEENNACCCFACRDEWVKQQDFDLYSRCVENLFEQDQSEKEELIEEVRIRLMYSHQHRTILLKAMLDILNNNQFQAKGAWSSWLPDVEHCLKPEEKELVREGIKALNNVNKGVKIETAFDGFASMAGSLFSGAKDVFKFVTGDNSLAISGVLFVVMLFLKKRYPTSAAISGLTLFFGGWCLSNVVNPFVREYVLKWFVGGSTPQAADGEDIVDIAVEGLCLSLFARKADFKDLKSFGKTIVDIDKESKSLSSYLNRVKDWIMKLIETIASWCGKDLNLRYTAHENELSNISRGVKSLLESYLDENGQYILSSSEKLQKLNMEILTLKCSLSASREDAPVSVVLGNYMRMLDPVKKLAQEAGYVERMEPFLYYVVSHPDVGKTFSHNTATNEIITAMMTSSELIDFEKNPGRLKYSNIVGAKHADGYMGQLLYEMNDVFTGTDAEGQESEATFIVSAVGCNEMKLPQAVAEKKGLIALLAKVIACNGNQTILTSAMFKSIKTIEALIRRMNKYCYYMYVKKEFRRESSLSKVNQQMIFHTKDDERFWATLDVSKLAAGVDPETHINFDCYEFCRWDCRTGKPINPDTEVWGFWQWIEHMRKDYRKHFQSGEVKVAAEKVLLNRAIAKRRAELQAEMLAVPRNGDIIPMADAENHFEMCEPLSEGESEFSECDFDEHCEGDTHYDPITKANIQMTKSQLRMRILRKCKLYQNEKVSLVPLMLQVNNTSEFSDFIKQYVRDCERAGERILMSNYHASYLKDPEHLFNTLIECVSLSDLKEIAKWSLCDDVIVRVLMCRDMCPNILYTITNVCSCTVELMHDSFKELVVTPLKWFINHPVVSSFVVFTGGYAIGYAVTSMIMNCIDWFVGRTEPNIHASSFVEIVSHAQGRKRTLDEEKFINARLCNCYKLVIRRTVHIDEKKYEYKMYPNNFWFLGDRTGFTSWHFYQLCMVYKSIPGTHKFEIGLSPFNRTTNECLWWSHINDLKFDVRSKEKDLVFVTWPMTIHQQPNILKYFPSRKDKEFIEYVQDPDNKLSITFVRKPDDKLDMDDITMSFLSKEVGYDVQYTYMCDITRQLYTNENLGLPTVRIKHHEVFEINKATRAGDCNAAGFLIDSVRHRFIKSERQDTKVFQNPIFAYFHHSGAHHGLIGNGMMLFREDFDCVANEIKYNISSHVERIETGINLTLQNFATTSNIMQCANFSMQPDPVPVKEFAVYHKVYAHVNRMPYNPRSVIKRSPLYKLEGVPAPTRWPVKLHGVDGVDLLAVSRNANGSNVHCVPYGQLMNTIHYVTDQIMTNSIPPNSRGVLSVEAGILGDVACHLPSLDRDTSGGPVLNLVRELLGYKGHGKKWIFGDGFKHDLNRPEAKAFIKTVLQEEEIAAGGDRPLDLFSDSLKDELRKPGKLPRLFSAGGATGLTNKRRYFGHFAGWVYDNRIRNGICVGINPFSHEWRAFYLSLFNISDNGIFGDFEKFDKLLLIVICYACLVLARKFYGDRDPRANIIREMLFENDVNSLHAVPDGMHTAVYEWLSANPSGTFLTAILNSVGGLVMFHFCGCALFLRQIRKEITFAKACEIPNDYVWKNHRSQTYGDDNAIAVRNMDYFNFHTLKDALKLYFNMNYTDALKTCEDIDPYTPICKGTFIGRTIDPVFINGELRVLARLRMYSIVEAFMWFRNGKIDLNELVKIVEGALLELSAYGKEIFQPMACAIKEATYRVTGRYPHYTEWFVAFSVLLERAGTMYTPMVALNPIDLDNILLPPPVSPLSIEEMAEVQEQIDAVESDTTPMDELKRISKELIFKESSLPSLVQDTPRNTERNCVPLFDIRGLNVIQSSDVNSRSDGGVHLNEPTEKAVVCDESKTTCWADGEGQVEASLRMPKMRTSIEIRSETIEDFLAKPQILGYAAYNNTACPTSIFTVSSIAALIQPGGASSIAAWTNKLLGYNLVRGTFNFKVEVNAFPFQSGVMMLHYFPNMSDNITLKPNMEKMYNSLIVSMFQHPYILLDVRDTVATLPVPYIAPAQFYPLKENVMDWGSVYLTGITPLRYGALEANYAEVTIFGYWTDVELSAPIVPQASVREVRENKGTVSASLKSVSKAANSLGSVPHLGAYFSQLGWAANLASGVASAFGWSKPRIDKTPEIVARHFSRYEGHWDGPSVGVSLGMSSVNSVAVVDRFSITGEDEMSFEFLKKIPCYDATYSWSVGSTGSGTSLYTKQISPSSFYTASSDGPYSGHTANYRQGGPIFYLSNVFSYWRGDIIMTIKFVKTMFHTGRFMITWTPCTNVDVTPTINTAASNSLYSLRHIVDLRDQDSIELTLPYMIYSQYLNTTGTDYYSGQVDITVINDLRAPASCGQTIDFLVWYKAGDNFEFQVPSKNNFASPAPYYPQASSGSYLVSTGIADTKQGVLSTEMSEECIGEHFTSVKQLISKKTQWFFTSSPASVNQWYFWPWAASVISINQTSGALTYPSMIGDSFSYFAPMYNYLRGGTSIEIGTTNYGSNITCTNIPGEFTGSNVTGPFYSASSGNPNGVGLAITPGAGTSNVIWLTASTHFFDVGTPSVVNVPYYNRFACSLIPFFDGQMEPLNSIASDRTLPSACAMFTGNSTNFAAAANPVFRSCSDDFAFSFFIGCPPLLTSYA